MLYTYDVLRVEQRIWMVCIVLFWPAMLFRLIQDPSSNVLSPLQYESLKFEIASCAIGISSMCGIVPSTTKHCVAHTHEWTYCHSVCGIGSQWITCVSLSYCVIDMLLSCHTCIVSCAWYSVFNFLPSIPVYLRRVTIIMSGELSKLVCCVWVVVLIHL